MKDLLDIIQEARANHFVTDVWCRNCGMRWKIVAPHVLHITDKTTKEDEEAFYRAHHNVCPKCNHVMNPYDIIKSKMTLDSEWNEYGDRPWQVDNS